MDALARIGAFFPFKTITVYFILSNVIINNVGDCAEQQRQLMIALLVIFCVLNILACFTDTYTASNSIKFWVFIIPFYGPLCFSLPSDWDKDRVYEYFYLRYRDYVHAFTSVLTFLLIIIFSNPISMCLCPSGRSDGTARFDAAVIRTVPILIAIIMSGLMVCLGPPRQMLGLQNVSETCPPIDQQRAIGDNPAFKAFPGEGSLPGGEEDYMDEEAGPVPHGYGGGTRSFTKAPPRAYSGREGGVPHPDPNAAYAAKAGAAATQTQQHRAGGVPASPRIPAGRPDAAQ